MSSPAGSQGPELVITVGGTFTPAPAAPPPGPAAQAGPAAPPSAAQAGPAAPPSAASPGTVPPARRSATTSQAQPAAGVVEDLAGWAREYVAGRAGQQISVLLAGCTTASSDLGAGCLRAAGHDITVTLVDDDQPVTRAAVRTHPALARCSLGDLRTVPLPPRSCDLVLCAFLLHRVRHAELVLDRLTTAVKPGGLLFVQLRDRDTAAGFLDRVLPEPARRRLWRRRWPSRPGPHPAIYEPLSSARGIHAYAQRHGLAVAGRRALGGRAGKLGRPPVGLLTVQRLIGWLSRGRLSADHEELLYVLRKPEDRFARLL